MNRNSKRSKSRVGFLMLAGAALASLIIAPTVGSAALNGGAFFVKSVNEENSEIFSISGMGSGNSNGGETPEVPTDPVDRSSIANYTIQTNLPSCSTPGLAFGSPAPTATIHWGDGQTTPATTGQITHEYATPGEYKIRIEGQVPAFATMTVAMATCIKGMDSWGEAMGTISAANMFQYANNLEYVPARLPSTVTNTSQMLGNTYIFNQDISNWDVSNVTEAVGMFAGSAFNQDISGWDVSGITSMSNMFGNASKFNQDISSWEVGQVTDFRNMFNGAGSFNQDLSDWDMSSATNLSGMFSRTRDFNQDISAWDVSNVTSMASMFENAKGFNTPINWGAKTAKLTDVTKMFYQAEAFNQRITWDTSNVTTMREMFSLTKAYNQNVSDWSTAKLTNISKMFYGAQAFDQDLSGWKFAGSVNNTNLVVNSKMYSPYPDCNAKMPMGWRCVG